MEITNRVILADKSEISSDKTIKLKNEPNKERREEVEDKTVKIKCKPNKINLRIESVRQKNSAPIAKRVSGDGPFCHSIHLFLCGIYLAGCALIGGAAGFPKKCERSEQFFGTASVATCIYKGTPCAHLFKKAVFCRVLSCLIV